MQGGLGRPLEDGRKCDVVSDGEPSDPHCQTYCCLSLQAEDINNNA